MRIAFDVSPLSHALLGIGRYLRGSLGGLAEAAGSEHEIVPFAPTSPQGLKAIPAALDGIPVEARLRFLPFAHYWRQAWSRSGWPPVERFLGPFDVLHYSDWMYPPQRGGVRATTVHDLVPLRFPEWVHARTRRMHTAKYRDLGRCDVVFANSAFTAREVTELTGRAGRARARGLSRHRSALPAGRRARRPGRAVRPQRRHLRAAEEPRRARLGVRAARAGRREARARRRRRLGRAAAARPSRRRPARVRRRRRARAALPRRLGVRLPVAVRGLRDPDRRGDGERRPCRCVGARVDGRGFGRRGAASRPREPGGVRRGDRARPRRSRRRGRARPRTRGALHLARDRPRLPPRLRGGG